MQQKFQSPEHRVSEPGTHSSKAWNTQFQSPEHTVSNAWNTQFQGLKLYGCYISH